MRIDGTLYFVLQDHLGSASVVTDASGTIVGETCFYPFGETRFSTGTMYTDKLFTGQREITGAGIYHYGARFYSPKLGRFLSADTIVPGFANPQNLNRYSYVTNNPLRYTDPTGHMLWEGEGGNLTPLQKAIDAQKQKKHEKEAAKRKCENGDRSNCSYYDNFGDNIKRDAKYLYGDLKSAAQDAWTTLTSPLSTVTVGNTIVEPGINLACGSAKKPCPGAARAIGETADAILDAISMVFNSNRPSTNKNPITPTPVSPWITWTPDPTATGVTPTMTMTPEPTATLTVSPTQSLTPTQLPTGTPTMTPTLPYITPTYRP